MPKLGLAVAVSADILPCINDQGYLGGQETTAAAQGMRLKHFNALYQKQIESVGGRDQQQTSVQLRGT
ncbi:hypothetical protein HYQ46_003846 [Verticillium longisporum]|nr:hypothetical protein HYQ46_003846 [Verticillium longisporum]